MKVLIKVDENYYFVNTVIELTSFWQMTLNKMEITVYTFVFVVIVKLFDSWVIILKTSAYHLESIVLVETAFCMAD